MEDVLIGEHFMEMSFDIANTRLCLLYMILTANGPPSFKSEFDFFRSQLPHFLDVFRWNLN